MSRVEAQKGQAQTGQAQEDQAQEDQAQEDQAQEGRATAATPGPETPSARRAAPAKVCVFDAYGTLFDVDAAARAVAAEPGREALGEIWPEISGLWRRKQLEYSWLRQSAGRYVDFWTVTENALDCAMEACRLTDASLRERLLSLYFELGAFPEVPDMLMRLKAAGMGTAILSNGEPHMLDAAVRSARIGEFLDAVLSVDEIRTYKPAPTVYDLVGQHFGTASGEVLFVSSNGWDICAAADHGFDTVWINRSRQPRDRLWAEPARERVDLTYIPEMATGA